MNLYSNIVSLHMSSYHTGVIVWVDSSGDVHQDLVTFKDLYIMMKEHFKDPLMQYTDIVRLWSILSNKEVSPRDVIVATSFTPSVLNDLYTLVKYAVPCGDMVAFGCDPKSLLQDLYAEREDSTENWVLYRLYPPQSTPNSFYKNALCIKNKVTGKVFITQSFCDGDVVLYHPHDCILSESGTGIGYKLTIEQTSQGFIICRRVDRVSL